MAFRPRLYDVLHAAHGVEDEGEKHLGRIGVSGGKIAALTALAEAAESLPLSQLAGRLSCVKSNITQLVDRLEADGLVARKPDPNDRRTRLAVMTAAGRRACKEGRRIQQQTERDLFGALTGDEARQLAALMGKLTPRVE